MNEREDRFDGAVWIALVLFVISAALFTLISSRLLHQTLTQEIPFDTDEADHANAALELFRTLQQGSAHAIWEAVIRQAFYPPIHSFFVAISYFLLGVSTAASRVPSVMFFIALGVSLALTSYRASQIVYKSQSSAIIAAAAAVLFIAHSKITLVNSSLCMLELCGTFFVSVLLFHLLLRNGSEPSIKGIIFLAFVIMLTKYSFGIIVIPGILFGAATAPTRLAFSSAGILRSLKILVGFLVLFGVWFFLSNREAIINFIIGHPNYAPLLSSKNLVFDLRSWLFEYSSAPMLAGGILILAILGAFNSWHLLATRVSVGIVLAAFSILLISTTNESRHFMVAAPPLWYLGSVGLATVSQGGKRLHPRYASMLAFSILIAYFSGAYGLVPKLPALISREMEGEPFYAKLEDFIVENISCNKPSLIIGASDQFGIEALRWRTAAACKLPYTKIEIDAFPYNDRENLTNRRRMRNVDYPYRDPSFPKSSIEEILNAKHYHALVFIREIGEHGTLSSLINKFKESVSTAPTTIATDGGKEITIISLL